MKLRLEPRAIYFRLSLAEANSLLAGISLTESIHLQAEQRIEWTVSATRQLHPSLAGLELALPISFLEQETLAKRPSRQGLSFKAGENTVYVQVDIRSKPAAT